MAGDGIVRWGSNGTINTGGAKGFENKPVVYVSWFDGARFTNWLGNGQGNGDTESGAYTLNGKKSGIVLINAGAGVYLPSEDQWDKASYYDAVNNTYLLYSTQSNSITTDDANFNSSGSVEIGSYSLTSYYGTYDQAGNICEWNDAVRPSNRQWFRGEPSPAVKCPAIDIKLQRPPTDRVPRHRLPRRRQGARAKLVPDHPALPWEVS